MPIKRLPSNGLRDMRFARAAVDNIEQAALLPEVGAALLAWVAAETPENVAHGVLIGAVALSFYVKPRYTEDVDILFLHKSDIPTTIPGFKAHRKGAFQENKTHVEIEVVTGNSFSPPVPQAIVSKVFATAVMHGKIRVASAEGLVALKLYGAGNPERHFKDLGDVTSILLEHNPKLDMIGWNLGEEEIARYFEVKTKLGML
jgi:hypothetical protein